MSRKKTKKFDKVGTGFLIGFVVPVIVFFLAYLIGDNDVNFFQHSRSLWKLNAFVKLGSLCVFVNSAVFMGFIKLKYEKTARGILGATIIYALAVLLSRAF